MQELPWWLSGKASTCQCKEMQVQSLGWKAPWRRKWQPTPVFLPGESHGQRSLAGNSPWIRKELDTTYQLNKSNLMQGSYFIGFSCFILSKQVKVSSSKYKIFFPFSFLCFFPLPTPLLMAFSFMHVVGGRFQKIHKHWQADSLVLATWEAPHELLSISIEVID